MLIQALEPAEATGRDARTPGGGDEGQCDRESVGIREPPGHPHPNRAISSKWGNNHISNQDEAFACPCRRAYPGRRHAFLFGSLSYRPKCRRRSLRPSLGNGAPALHFQRPFVTPSAEDQAQQPGTKDARLLVVCSYACTIYYSSTVDRY